MKKCEYCPVCGGKGEDLIFAFYCLNPRCQNFHEQEIKKEEEQEEEEYEDMFAYFNNYWPFGD